MLTPPEIRHLGLQPYAPVYRDMRTFTDQCHPGSGDEIWVLQHEPVYTLGLGGKLEHVLNPGSIPLVRTDRGGQVTYHGPGQLIVYLLLNIQRRNLSVRTLVSNLEQSVINSVAPMGIKAERITGAPGVYVGGRKLAALGLRVRKGRTYHGLAVNVDGDLAPFAGINPCGYAGLPVTRLTDLGARVSPDEFAVSLLPELCRLLDTYPAPALSQTHRIPQAETIHG